ncbi:hypothetical protein S-CBP2_0004 [Synechococcus phage S-CBP2]|uniref:Uncharacterized protein n=1 Tax=Synechococcus phage S-CBP2 TaxID=756277 RepID=A0A096VKW9_9CAUD|nr:hypothetical protein S-CBP2_0004 [Synechococcus phage S-CBP2]AGF91125.1 hypothetical protein SXHG_00103 [Synechococcus phage MRHenn-2013a]AGK86710.1 hypothetical protein S-CBP2_0004 [Synechococcus phage S-CBP2]
MTRTYQLFLGRNIPTGGVVTDDQFDTFLQHVPFDGFTITDAVGYWKGEPEATKVLTVCTDVDDARVMQTAELYKGMFQQEAVAIQELPAMAFV